VIDLHIGRMLCDVEIGKGCEVSNEIQRLVIIRQTMGFDPMGM